MRDLVLASTSASRRAQLERLGLPFRCVAPRVDEEALKDPALSPRELARRLARAKAASVAAECPRAVVIGGDQVVALDGRTHGKPGTPERAAAQLLELQGRAHEIITAVAVVDVAAGTWRESVDVTVLWMRELDRAAAERYVAADDPTACAGSYKLESRGVTLFERIESADHSAVTGLPLIALTTILRAIGFTVP